MIMSCSLISVTERLPGPALQLGALPPVSTLTAVTAGVQFSAPGLKLTLMMTMLMTMLVTMAMGELMVTRKLVPGLVSSKLLGATLLAHCARAPR